MAEQKHQRPPFTMIILYIVLAGAILLASFPTPAPATKQVTYSEFLDAVHGGQLAAVRITSTDLVGTLKQTGKTAAPSGIRTPRVPAMDESWLIKELTDSKVQVVVVDRPDIDGREAILKVHSRKIKLGATADLRKVAARTPGMVGADLANIINEAALLAARRQGEQVEMYDIDEAIDRVMLGLEKKNRVMSAAEKERVAYHEAGHALVALSVGHAAPVHRVSIIPRSAGALGHTLQLPTEERFLMTRSELRDQLTVMLGGRAAEEIIFHGEISTGAADDLERASELARQMVTRFGMSERLGHLTYGKSAAGRFLQSPFTGDERNYSDRTAEVIDDEVQRLISEAHDSSQSILQSRYALLAHIAQELIQKETLDRAALEDLIRRSSENVIS